MAPATLIDALRGAAREEGDRRAFLYLADGEREAGELSYGELDRRARAVGRALAEGGLAGERALLLYPHGLDFVVAFWGCLYAGVTAVPAYPPRGGRRLGGLAHLLAAAAPAAVLTTSVLARRLGRGADPDDPVLALPWLATDESAEVDPGSWEPADASPEDLAFLQYTSGSTTAPRGVEVSHGNLAANEAAIEAAFGLDRDSVIVSWLPLYHDMGLIGTTLQPLWLRATAVLMSPFAFFQRPYRWLAAIARYGATASGGPNSAYELCVRRVGREEREGLDLSSWDVAFNGAEPVDPGTLERFTRAFASRGFQARSFFPCYGLAEATLLVSTGRWRSSEGEPCGTGGVEAGGSVSCGPPAGEMRVVVVDPEVRTERPEGEEGEIWLAGPSIARGYRGGRDAEAESSTTFGACLADGKDSAGPAGGFLRTGDLGVLAGGQLRVTGRIKDLILLHGRNVYPQDVERIGAGAHPDLAGRAAAAFSVPGPEGERLVLVSEVGRRAETKAGEAARAVRRRLARELGLSLHALVLTGPGGVPTTSSGKVRRRDTRRAYLAGELSEVGRSEIAAGTEAAPPLFGLAAGESLAEELEIFEESQLASLPNSQAGALLEQILVRALARLTGLDPEEIDPAIPPVEAGMDSLAAARLSEGLDRRLGVRLPLERFFEAASLGELAEELLSLQGEPSPASVPVSAAPQPFAPQSGAPQSGAPKPGATEPDTAEPAVEATGENAAGSLPLSVGQQALVFLQRLSPESAAYVLAVALRMPGEADAPALRRSLAALAERHPQLRAVFTSDDTSRQRILPPFVPELEVGAPVGGTDAASLAADAFRPLPLEGDRPPWRARLIPEAANGPLLVLSVHHAVADFASLVVLLEELAALYRAETEGAVGAPLPAAPEASYAEHVAARARYLAGPKAERDLAYWRRALPSPLPVLDLPADRPRPPRPGHRGRTAFGGLDAAVSDRLLAFCRERGATPFMALAAVHAAFLHRSGGGERVLLGAPTEGRSGGRFRRVVGYFVNPVVLALDLGGRLTGEELLERVRAAALGALAHAEMPFPTLVESLQPERDPSRSPLFQTLCAWQQAPPGREGLAALALGAAGAPVAMAGGVWEPTALPSRAAAFDLTLMGGAWGGRVHLSLQLSSDLFDEAAADRFLRRLEVLAAELVEHPKRPVEALDWMAPEERRQLLAKGRGLPPAEVGTGLAHTYFFERARESPDATALVVGDEQLSYGALAARALRLAGALVARGLGPETPLGIALSRSSDLPAAVLGALAAGCPWVPLDPAYPEERLRAVAEQARMPWVLTDGALTDGTWEPAGPFGEGSRPLRITELVGAGSPAPLRELRRADPECLSHVIFTSATTGRPKGVAIRHRAVAALLGWARRTFRTEELAGVLAATSISFDLSVFELLAPATRGGTVVLVRDALALAELPGARRVTLVNTVPSALAELLRLGALPPALYTVNLAGEALPAALARAIHALGTVERLNNLYGPSEDTTYSTHAAVPAELDGAPSIGEPLPGTRVWLADRWLRLVPPGLPGEILLGGEGLARGYLGRPGLTAASFVADPWSDEPGARLYRAGDLGRRRPDGPLEYLGRLDFQVKLRGFRIELGEIEGALEARSEVSRAVVTAGSGEATGDRLIAYVAPETPEASSCDGAAERLSELLRASLRSKLPVYMVPSVFVILSALPLLPNGKVDRRALPEPHPTSSPRPGAGEPPRTPIEKVVAEIFGEVLRLPKVGADDNFFELGGHSLIATQVVSRVREAFGVELLLRTLFEAPTVGALAVQIQEAVDSGARPALPPVEALPKEGLLPLSFAQQRLWLLDRLQPGSPFYNVPGTVRMEGDLAVAALAWSLGRVVRRHSVLRSVFQERGGRLFQEIQSPAPVPLPVVDISGLEPEARTRRLRRLAVAEAGRSFHLDRGPMLRALLVRETPRLHTLLLTLHHIVSDGWSVGLLVAELRELYGARVAGAEPVLEPLPVQYADFAVWQRGWLEGETMAEQLEYWRCRLEDPPPFLDLPVDRPRPAMPSFRGDRVTAALPGGPTAELQRLSRRSGSTLFMVLLAGLQGLLYRYTGQRDVAVGTPIAGRNHLAIEPLIGFFVNTLVLRSRVEPGESFRYLLGQVREAALEAHTHQDVPFERLVEALQPERSLQRTPFFQVWFALQNAPLTELELPGLRLQQREAETATAKFDLTIAFREEGGRLMGTFDFATEIFDRATIERLAGHYRTLLESVAAAPESAVAALEVLRAPERQQVVRELPPSILLRSGRAALGTDSPPARTVLDGIREAAERWPEATAVTFREEALSYRELLLRAEALAGVLRGGGVGPGARVGLYLRHSPSLVVGALGVLASGAAYVALDPSSPAPRTAGMADDAGIALCLADVEALESIGETVPWGAAPVRELPPGGFPASGATVSGELLRPPPELPAYVLYTSGSTGRPKGVVVSHASLAAYCEWAAVAYFREAGASSALHSPLSFDLTVTSLYPPLLRGRKVAVFREEGGEPVILRVFASGRADVVKLTPSHLGLVRAAGIGTAGAPIVGVRRLVVGGEALGGDLACWFTERIPGVEVLNEYGPTEATVGCMIHAFDPVADARGAVPIGRAAAGARILITDRYLRPIPRGAAGELLIGGPGLADGYLGRPCRTAVSFVPDPHAGSGPQAGPGSSGARLYRSGDLARYLADGRVEYLGRIDGQVKIRGHRIEPGEIEAVLKAHRRVRGAVVRLLADGKGGRVLAAYYAARREIPSEELRELLAVSLPDAMVPQVFVPLPRLPLTLHGKVNTEALPSLEEILAQRKEPAAGDDAAAPTGPTEEILAGIWAEVLGLSEVGRDVDFFAVGGHSLLAAQVVSRVRAAFGVELPLRHVFEGLTVRQLAGRIQALARPDEGGAPVGPVPLPRKDGQTFPLSYAQQRLWFLDRLGTGGTPYNVTVWLRLDGELAPEHLERSLTRLVERHEALRTRFPEVGSRPRQVIDPPPARCPVPLVDLRGLTAEDRSASAARAARAIAALPFRLERGPLLRLCLLRLNPALHQLVISQHHIVSDGWSMGVLVREIGAIYRAFHAGEPAELPELPVQYPDFAVWQRRYLDEEAMESQLSFWESRLGPVPKLLEVPTDHPRPDEPGHRGRLEPWTAATELRERLRRVERGRGVTPFLVLLSAFEVLLGWWTGQNELIVGTDTAGRSHRDIEGLAGFFVNQMALPAHLGSDETFGELLDRNRSLALEAYGRQHVPFDHLVERLRVPRTLRHPPLIQVKLNYHSFPVPDLDLPDLRMELLPLDTGTAKLDLIFDVVPASEGFSGSCTYDADLFEPGTIRRVLGNFTYLLERVAEDSDVPLAVLRQSLDEREGRHGEDSRSRFREQRRRGLRRRKAALTPLLSKEV